MTIVELVEKIKTQPENIQFSEIIETVDASYIFTPTDFKNGDTMNEANQNNGSCKVFSFAKKQNLTKEETLACFGDYYRKDVLENPESTDHQNIRNFITFGWDRIEFDGEALSEKI
jgi:HopJ type III effector protein